MDIKELIQNANLIGKSKIKFNEPMSKHTTFKIGGPAECLIKVNNIQELIKVLEFANKNKVPITILGNGSNILVLDGGIKGIVLKIDMQEINIEEKDIDIIATVGAGTKITVLAGKLMQNGITGFEELSGIPGTIGGAIKMNAGAHQKEMKDIITKVKCIDYDGNIKEFENKELEFAYRKSIFENKKYIILEAQMKLQKGKKEEIQAKMDKYSKYRKENQPIGIPSAGSTFKRGNDYITAKLIDEAGLKGYKIGGAEVSTKHSGFIVNSNNATAEDVIKLIKYVEDEVYKKFGRKIELEIEILGDK